MTPDQIKLARKCLNLSTSQLAHVLETDAQTIRRMEMQPDRSTHRPLAARMQRLIKAYLAGYRPADWPSKQHPHRDDLGVD